MKEHILERNLTNAINVVKPFYLPAILEFMKEHILERNLTSVINVIKPLHKGVTFKAIK
jgi:KRAB domain-containing zinc finger protein